MNKTQDDTALDQVGLNGEEITQIGHIVSEHQQCPVIVPCKRLVAFKSANRKCAIICRICYGTLSTYGLFVCCMLKCL